jgi:hypothetical protein
VENQRYLREVKRAGLAVAAALSLTARAPAADSIVDLTLEGRPVDRERGVAVMHDGFVFADAIDLTRCFDGFITLLRGGAATVTIGPNTGTFTPGSPRATINTASVALPGAPFKRNGELFVPLEIFISRVAGAQVRLSRVHRSADIRVGTRRRR